MIHGDTVRFSAYTIGDGAMTALYEALKGLRVAVISGEKSWAAAKDRLPRLDICCHIKYGPECTMEVIGQAAEAAGEAGAQAILGIGGGKALDVAKAAGQLIGLPVYTLPTIAATCAAVTALSIVYHADGKLDQFILLDAPPVHVFLDTALLVAAPARYFRAGITDAMAKHLESTFCARNAQLDYVSRLGLEIGRSIYEPLLSVGEAAYADCLRGEATDAFAMAVQCALVSTGMTSLLVDTKYNGAVAHSVCYGLGSLPGVEGRILHGELVGYGCLVQLMLDNQPELLARHRAFLVALGSPVTLGEMEIPMTDEALAPAVAAALPVPDMEYVPYPITGEMLLAAMRAVEAL